MCHENLIMSLSEPWSKIGWETLLYTKGRRWLQWKKVWETLHYMKGRRFQWKKVKKPKGEDDFSEERLRNIALYERETMISVKKGLETLHYTKRWRWCQRKKVEKHWIMRKGEDDFSEKRFRKTALFQKMKMMWMKKGWEMLRHTKGRRWFQ